MAAKSLRQRGRAANWRGLSIIWSFQRLEGSVLAVVQAADEEFVPGEKIRLLRTGGTTRVAKAPR